MRLLPQPLPKSIRRRSKSTCFQVSSRMAPLRAAVATPKRTNSFIWGSRLGGVDQRLHLRTCQPKVARQRGAHGHNELGLPFDPAVSLGVVDCCLERAQFTQQGSLLLHSQWIHTSLACPRERIREVVTVFTDQSTALDGAIVSHENTQRATSLMIVIT